MKFRPSRPTRRTAAALTASTALVAGTALAAGSASAAVPPPTHAPGATIVVGPGVDLRAQLRDLLPGDTLLLKPGTYTQAVPANPLRPADIRPVIRPGQPDARITVRAYDPAHRPLIKAHLELWGASYWTIDGLRIQTIAANESALTLNGGTGWIVQHSEIWGARKTGAYANVSIASDTGPGSNGTGAPAGFLFTNNCVHDAANVISRGAPTDHNMYVKFQGDAGSGGVISRNVIYGSPNGAGIKLGYGGAPNALGPWGVQVLHNTIADGSYQVVMHGNVRNNVISGNLFYSATHKYSRSPKTTAVYVHDVTGTRNTFSHNYAAKVSLFAANVKAKPVVKGGDNGVRPNPKVNKTNACGGYQPAYAKAKAYGRLGSAQWPSWAAPLKKKTKTK